MPHVTKLSDYELQRGDPAIDGLEDSLEDEGRHSKVVTVEAKDAPVISTTAITKDVDES